MRALAATQRFEEAAELRDRAAALSRALHRQHRFDALVRAGRLVVEEPGGEQSQLDQGRLVCASVSSPSALFPAALFPSMPPPFVPLTLPVSTDVADELACVASWLDARASRLRVIDCDGGLAWPLPRLPRFEPAAQSVSRRRC
jgi:DNA polymerase-3 subunit epsilon